MGHCSIFFYWATENFIKFTVYSSSMYEHLSVWADRRRLLPLELALSLSNMT